MFTKDAPATKGLQSAVIDRGKKLKVAAVLPAYNEENRLGRVIDAVRQASLVDEIVVVNDGSTDGTGEVVGDCPDVRVVNLAENVGKGGAMSAGARATDADVIVFLDADLRGITGDKIDSIARPVVEDRLDMCIGVFRGGRCVTDIAQILAPYISGQRAIYRRLFLEIPDIEDVRSGVEVAITMHSRANDFRTGTVVLTGCTHAMKEEKLGWVRGFGARLKMYCEIGRIVLDGRRAEIKRQGVVTMLRKHVNRKHTSCE